MGGVTGLAYCLIHYFLNRFMIHTHMKHELIKFLFQLKNRTNIQIKDKANQMAISGEIHERLVSRKD
jgi:hypothetical protein